MIAVADAGPLIALAKVNALDLLTQLYQPAFITPAVFAEAITAGQALSAPDADILNQAVLGGHLQVRAPMTGPLLVPAVLHAGEQESIRLAIELRVDTLLVDELEARRAAQANFAAARIAISIRGTLGLIVTAYQQKVVIQQRAIDIVNALKARPDAI